MMVRKDKLVTHISMCIAISFMEIVFIIFSSHCVNATSFTLLGGQAFNSAIKSLAHDDTLSYNSIDDKIKTIEFFSDDSFSEEIDLSKLKSVYVDAAQVGNIVAYYDDLYRAVYIVSAGKIYAAQNASDMFNSFNGVTWIDASDLDVSSTTSMVDMFVCSDLKGVDIAGWNTANVKSITGMFAGCKNLQSIDMSSWDISNVIQSADISIFDYCLSLETIDTPRITGTKRIKLPEVSYKTWYDKSNNYDIVTIIPSGLTSAHHYMAINSNSTGQATLSIEGWTYGETPQIPVIDVWQGDYTNIQYYYKLADAPDTAYSRYIPRNPDYSPAIAGDYKLKAVLAQTNSWGGNV